MPENRTVKGKRFKVEDLESRAAMYEKLARECSLDVSKRAYEKEAKRIRRTIAVFDRLGWSKRNCVNNAIIKRDIIETR